MTSDSSGELNADSRLLDVVVWNFSVASVAEILDRHLSASQPREFGPEGVPFGDQGPDWLGAVPVPRLASGTRAELVNLTYRVVGAAGLLLPDLRLLDQLALTPRKIRHRHLHTAPRGFLR
jgi:hypothetical protein